jgi:hypothetical protein
MFYAGIDLYMDEFLAGKAELLPKDKCIELVFRAAVEMQGIMSSFSSSDARFNRKQAAMKAQELENIKAVYGSLARGG